MNFFAISGTTLKRIMHFWPPLWFTGISFEHISPDYRHIRVAMAFRFYNKNLHGLQYGGNLYSMTDPCHIMMILRNLGPTYRVLDKGASIDFIRPGLSKVTADCMITEADLEDIKANTVNGDKYFKDFEIEIKDANNEIVAKVIKKMYIRKKKPLK